MNVTNEQIARVLDRAIELLEAGWCQGHYAVSHANIATNPVDVRADSFCGVGAISRASWEAVHGLPIDGEWVAVPVRSGDLYAHVVHTVERMLAPHYNRGFESTLLPTGWSAAGVIGFNDDSSTTKEDVILLFKRAREALT